MYTMHTCPCAHNCINHPHMHAYFCIHIHTCICNMYTHTQKQEYVNSGCSIKFVCFMYATIQSGNTMKYNSFTHSFNKCCWFCNRRSLELTSECKQLCNCLEANPGSFITNVWPESMTFTSAKCRRTDCRLPQRSISRFKWVNTRKVLWKVSGTQWMPAKGLMNHVALGSGLQM